MVGNAVKNQQTENLYSNVNKPIDTTNMVSNAMRQHLNDDFNEEDLPDGLYVQNIKTVAKVWRYTWSVNEEILNIYKNAPEEQIYKPLLRFNITDVSNEYVSTTDIHLKLDEKFEVYKVAYLAVFDRSGWKPVAFGVPDKDGQVAFNNIGKNILYLPAVYNQNECIPVGDPFVVEADGRINYKSLNKDDKQFMRLIRKFPLFGSIALFSQKLKGIRFEGANSPTFNDAQLLHEVDYYPIDMIRVKINNPNKFRYLRCVSQNSGTDFAELKYLGKVDQDTVLLTGSPLILKVPGVRKRLEEKRLDRIKKLFDGDFMSLYGTDSAIDNWFGLDLGENKASQITEIQFCAKTDANFIIPGNQYELYYWDDKWIFFDDKTAEDYFLEFDNVPSNGVYWLKCTTEGKEERAFTYGEKGQVWW